MTNNKRPVNNSNESTADPDELLTDLFSAYALQLTGNYWPWEEARWHELVFSILTAIGEPEVMASTARSLTDSMADLGLLDIGLLAKSGKMDQAWAEIGDVDTKHAIEAILIRSGYTHVQAETAFKAISEVAATIRDNYGGKIQNYLRKYGEYMLGQMGRDLGLGGFDGWRNAGAIWLQNTLNMPVPASDALTNQACQSLGVTYASLVEAANRKNINIALVDDALRVHWEREQGITREDKADENEAPGGVAPSPVIKNRAK